MSDHIPEALLMDILATRLAIEDLVRCTAVCKSWHSLLTSSDFVSLHMKRLAAATTRNNNDIDLLLVRDTDPRWENKEYYSIHLHNNKNNDTIPLCKSLDFPFKGSGWNQHLRVVGCFNGVICLSDDIITFTNNIFLWNPSIRKFVTLPKPLVTFPSHGPFFHAIGFGFDSSANDYKVVRVVYFNTRKAGVLYPPMVEVYEVSLGSWRSVDPKGFSNFINDRTSQVFLNGAVYWTGYKDLNAAKDEFMKIIVSFDLTTEAFDVMKMPDSIAPGYLRGSTENLRVSLLGESLALIHHCQNSRNTSVWVMKQYGVADSWTKVFSMDITQSLLKVCGVLKSEEILVVEKHWSDYRQIKSLVSYDPKTKLMNHIRDIQNDRSVFVDYFVETLALLGVKSESIKQLCERRR